MEPVTGADGVDTLVMSLPVTQRAERVLFGVLAVMAVAGTVGSNLWLASTTTTSNRVGVLLLDAGYYGTMCALAAAGVLLARGRRSTPGSHGATMRAPKFFSRLSVLLPCVHLVGEVLTAVSFTRLTRPQQLGRVLAGEPFVVCMGVLLYVASVVLRLRALEPAAVPPSDGTAPETGSPTTTDAGLHGERLLDADAPVDLATFLPKEPPKMTAVPIGDPHGAFRRPSE